MAQKEIAADYINKQIYSYKSARNVVEEKKRNNYNIYKNRPTIHIFTILIYELVFAVLQ